MTKVRTPHAFAAPGCALLMGCSNAQGDGGIQPRGAFDPRWLCKALMAVAFVLCMLSAANGVQAQTVAPSTPPTVAQRFDAALLAYERNHWPEAYAGFTVLADGGHVQSARIAAQMHRWGPRLYSMRFVATTAQLALWQQLADTRAVELFRQGRFPEAYGRFIELANAGHPASARHALWMCEQGPTLFGSDWDCAPHEVEDWTRAAGVALPRIAMPQYVGPSLTTHLQPEKREIR